MGLKQHPLRLFIMGRQNIARRWQKPKAYQQPANGRRGSGRRKLASISAIRGYPMNNEPGIPRSKVTRQREFLRANSTR
jgi:hypothetical protein